MLEVFPSGEAQNQLLRQWKGAQPSFCIELFDGVDYILFGVPNQGTATSCQNILVPIDIWAIGKLDHKAIRGWSHNDWRLIVLAATPPNMPDNTERSERRPCQPAGKWIQGVLEQHEKAFTDLLW